MDHATKLRDLSEKYKRQADEWRFRNMQRAADVCLEHRDLVLYAADALDRLAALERELAEARKDGARLDWVISNFEEVNFDGWHDHADMDAMDLDMEDEVLAAWRKYIDAAMGGE